MDSEATPSSTNIVEGEWIRFAVLAAAHFTLGLIAGLFGAGFGSLIMLVPGMLWLRIAIQAHQTRIALHKDGSFDVTFGSFVWWQDPACASFKYGEYRIVRDMRVMGFFGNTDLVRLSSMDARKPIGTVGFLYRRSDWKQVHSQILAGQRQGS